MNPFATAIAEQVDLSFLNARVAHAPLTTEDTLPLSKKQHCNDSNKQCCNDSCS
jgi:hypothetical protein